MQRDEPNLSPEQLIGARDAAASLLDELGLSNYRFDVEPRGPDFDVHVEHARNGEWHAVSLHERGATLLGVHRDPRVREELKARWRARLCG